MKATQMQYLAAALVIASCGSPRPSGAKLTVAAAANLTDVFAAVGTAFTAKTGIDVVFSYGSTAQLAHQLENGAPFDLFAAADTEHIDSLIAAGKLTADSRAVYALGQLALWSPAGGISELKDLKSPQIRFIALAQPDSAPYGKASVEALKHFALWDSLQPKIVYANSISQARQLAASGNADATFTAYSLLLHEKGTILKVDPASYRPLEQALGVTASSVRQEETRRFRAFLLSQEGRAILWKSGYLLP